MAIILVLVLDKQWWNEVSEFTDTAVETLKYCEAILYLCITFLKIFTLPTSTVSAKRNFSFPCRLKLSYEQK